jgi:addiction module HigA family antidote
MRDYPPIHPGEILLEEFLKPMGISQYRLAKDISVPAMRINKIVRGQRGISADTALRLARYFGMSTEFWTGIQTHYEVEKAKMELAGRLEEEGAGCCLRRTTMSFSAPVASLPRRSSASNPLQTSSNLLGSQPPFRRLKRFWLDCALISGTFWMNFPST